MNVVEENPSDCRFEMAIDGERDVAAAYYKPSRDRLVLTHTIVPERLSGRGHGTRLAQSVFAELRATGRRAELVCPFMTAFHHRHPEFADVVVSSTEREIRT
jgi:uncharacterized protein